MKCILMLAAAMVLATTAASFANPCTNNYGVVVQCNAANGNINNNGFYPTNTNSNAQTQSQQQNQQQQQKSVNKNENYNAGNNQTTSITFSQDQIEQAPSVNAAALAGLAASECVLSDTQTAGGSIGVASLGLGLVEGTGHTKPYDECNTRAALPYVAAVKGSIHGVDSMVVYENMVATLSGVQAAIDVAKGVTPPAQSSATGQPPAAIAPQQTADATELPRCANDSLPAVTKMAMGCR